MTKWEGLTKEEQSLWKEEIKKNFVPDTLRLQAVSNAACPSCGKQAYFSGALGSYYCQTERDPKNPELYPFQFKEPIDLND